MGDEPGPTGLSAVHKLPVSMPHRQVLAAQSGHHSKTWNRKGLLCSGRTSCIWAAGAYVACASLLLAGRPSPTSHWPWSDWIGLLMFIWNYLGCQTSMYLVREEKYSAFILVRHDCFKVMLIVRSSWRGWQAVTEQCWRNSSPSIMSQNYSTVFWDVISVTGQHGTKTERREDKTSHHLTT